MADGTSLSPEQSQSTISGETLDQMANQVVGSVEAPNPASTDSTPHQGLLAKLTNMVGLGGLFATAPEAAPVPSEPTKPEVADSSVPPVSISGVGTDTSPLPEGVVSQPVAVSNPASMEASVAAPVLENTTNVENPLSATPISPEVSQNALPPPPENPVPITPVRGTN